GSPTGAATPPRCCCARGSATAASCAPSATWAATSSSTCAAAASIPSRSRPTAIPRRRSGASPPSPSATRAPWTSRGRFSPVGKVYLVGAGPGAPDLLTLRAARLLEAADVVLHDALVHPETLALARRARVLDVGKRAGRPSTDQRFIHRALVEAARSHAVVVRLKG